MSEHMTESVGIVEVLEDHIWWTPRDDGPAECWSVNDIDCGEQFTTGGEYRRHLARLIAARQDEALRSVVGDLAPALRAEAERLRAIKVLSVALWMESEADRLERVLPPADQGGQGRD